MLLSQGSQFQGYKVHLWILYPKILFSLRGDGDVGSLSAGELLLIICLVTAEAKRGFCRCDLSLEGNISFQRGSQQIDLSFIHGCGSLVLFCSGPTKPHEYYSLWSGHLLLRSAKHFLALASRVCVNSSELIWPELLGGVNVVWQLACWIPWGGKLWLPLDALTVHTAEGWAAALLDPRAIIYPCRSAPLSHSLAPLGWGGELWGQKGENWWAGIRTAWQVKPKLHTQAKHNKEFTLSSRGQAGSGEQGSHMEWCLGIKNAKLWTSPLPFLQLLWLSITPEGLGHPCGDVCQLSWQHGVENRKSLFFSLLCEQ